MTPDGEELQHFNFFDYPQTLSKKVILLYHFKSFLDGNQKFRPLAFPFGPESAPERSLPLGQPLVYLRKWKNVRQALLFRMSNKLIQVVFAEDRSEIIICSVSGYVTYVSAAKAIKRMPIASDIEAKDPSMYKRLQFAKEVLMQPAAPKSSRRHA